MKSNNTIRDGIKWTIEEQYYNRNRQRWLREGKEGLFALIREQKTLGFYNRIVEARGAAMLILSREGGNFIHQPMLICEIHDS